MVKFIEMRPDFNYSKDPEDPSDYGTGAEIVRTDLIRNLFIAYPCKTEIHITFENKKGGCQDVVETFDTELECAIRFNEIRRILVKE